MKINSYLLFVLLGILLSYSLAVDISKQETTTQKSKEPADKVEAKGEEGKYGVNYGGGGGGNYGGGGGGSWGGGCGHGCCYRGYGGSCNRCCASPEEAKAFSENQAEAKEAEAADTHKQVEDKGEEGQYGVNYGGGGGGSYGGGGGGWGGGCRHGCCYRGHGGSCNRCCASPEEAKAVVGNKEAKGDDGKYGVNYGGGGGNYGGGGGGGSWGGGCRHGCCYRGHGGSCNKCCSSPQEAKAFADNQSHP